MKTNKKEITTANMALSVAQIIVSIGVIVTASLQLFGILDKAINVCVPLLGVELILQSIREWKKNLPVAIFSLCAAVFIFICAIVVFL